MFELYFSHSGRINRKVFIWSWLFLVVLQILLSSFIPNRFLMYLLYIPTSYGMVALAIKRFHDLSKSGWYYLFLLIPIINFYFLYLLYFKKGTQGDNPYGSDPLNNHKKENKLAHSSSTLNENQHPSDIVFDSKPVVSNPSSGFGKKLILSFGILCLIIAGVFIYRKNLDSSGNDGQEKLSKQSPHFNRGLSNLPKKMNTDGEDEISRFIFQVLNIDKDEVTVKFEKDIPMNIKFFGVSKDLVRTAEVLSRGNQRQAVIYLDSASLLQIGKKYYGYLKRSPEEAGSSAKEDWL